MGEGWQGGFRKSYSGPAEIASFSRWDSGRSMTYSAMLYRLDISTFYFYEPLPFPIFVPWKFVKI